MFFSGGSGNHVFFPQDYDVAYGCVVGLLPNFFSKVHIVHPVQLWPLLVATGYK